MGGEVRKVLLSETEADRKEHGFAPSRYEVHFKSAAGQSWQVWSTNRTKLGALIEYWSAGLCYGRRLVDNGRDWRKHESM